MLGGLENLLQVVERQRERKARRTNHGSDVLTGSTFTVASLNSTATHDVDRSHPTTDSVSYGDRGVVVERVRHRADEPVTLKSESSFRWNGDAPKVIPRKIASMPNQWRAFRAGMIWSNGSSPRISFAAILVLLRVFLKCQNATGVPNNVQTCFSRSCKLFVGNCVSSGTVMTWGGCRIS